MRYIPVMPIMSRKIVDPLESGIESEIFN
jgi:hypothetical protein